LKLVILILLGAAFILNSIVLDIVYPTAATDYYKYIERDEVRHQVYELMFAAFFLLTFLLSEKIMRAIACFMFCLSFGSAIDKLIGITWYLKSDVVLIFLSLFIAIYTYVRELKPRG
jgi:hypothetical protein